MLVASHPVCSSTPWLTAHGIDRWKQQRIVTGRRRRLAFRTGFAIPFILIYSARRSASLLLCLLPWLLALGQVLCLSHPGGIFISHLGRVFPRRHARASSSRSSSMLLWVTPHEPAPRGSWLRGVSRGLLGCDSYCATASGVAAGAAGAAAIAAIAGIAAIAASHRGHRRACLDLSTPL
jgi:hypothetical protein